MTNYKKALEKKHAEVVKFSKAEWEKDTLRSMREYFDEESFNFGFNALMEQTVKLCEALEQCKETRKLIQESPLGKTYSVTINKEAYEALAAFNAWLGESNGK